MEVIILTNGPGELSTWVPPVLSRIKDRFPAAETTLYLLTDQFSSGTERIKAQHYGVRRLGSRAGFTRRLLAGRSVGEGRILQLGGAVRDLMLLKRATGFPAYAYNFHGRGWRKGLDGLLVDRAAAREEALARGADPARVHVVGNLVVDALGKAQPRHDGADLLLLPGSRPFAARYMLGFMLRVAERVVAARPGLRVAWLRSSLLSEAVVRQALSGTLTEQIGGVGATLRGDQLNTANGLLVRVLDESEHYGAMLGARAALTIPGTNTLELALAGLPSAVLLPLHRPELLPLEGPAHWVGLLPGVGPWLKRHIVLAFESRIKLLALPNSWLGEMVFPELRGLFTPEQAADTVLELLEPSRVRAVREALLRLPADPGADALMKVVFP